MPPGAPAQGRGGRTTAALFLAGSLCALPTGCAPDAPPDAPTACEEAEARLHLRACVHAVPDLDTWTSIAVDAGTADQDLATKYLLPAAGDAPLPLLFLDANHFTLHLLFLTQAFPELYAGLDFDGYVRLVTDPEARAYWAGDVATWIERDGSRTFGFTVWHDPADDTSLPSEAEVTRVWWSLQAAFGAAELHWVPWGAAQAEVAEGWGDTAFPRRGADDELRYEAYNEGETWGRVRLQAVDTLAADTEAAAFGWQDLLVLDEAPFDVEVVVAGLVTGTRQGALSHLSVRSAARGTPNCYVADPWTALAAWEGQLVHFTCGATGYTVEAATEEVAEAAWEAMRPEPVEVPSPDLDQTALPGLLELATTTAPERAAGTAAWGAKGTNLATLYQRLPDAVQLDGFVVPMAAYADFVEGGTWTWDGRTESFRESLERWAEDEAFRTDGALRRERLAALQAAMRSTPPGAAWEEAVRARILEVFGDPTVAVRLRSSSNAEDALGFSGAGLYDSRTACLADELDDDEVGPSACDPEEEDEEPLGPALAAVWASLWNVRAWEERDWYGIDMRDVAMGVLVDTRVDEERANVVAFTGNPGAVPAEGQPDPLMVEAQLGELAVVSAESGVWPETELLTLEDGRVVTITRVTPSSEGVEGGQVLTDGQLRELGAWMAELDAVYPRDDEAPEGATILLDTEWKLRHDGTWVVKQVRPYLRE